MIYLKLLICVVPVNIREMKFHAGFQKIIQPNTKVFILDLGVLMAIY